MAVARSEVPALRLRLKRRGLSRVAERLPHPRGEGESVWRRRQSDEIVEYPGRFIFPLSHVIEGGQFCTSPCAERKVPELFEIVVFGFRVAGEPHHRVGSKEMKVRDRPPLRSTELVERTFEFRERRTVATLLLEQARLDEERYRAPRLCLLREVGFEEGCRRVAPAQRDSCEQLVRRTPQTNVIVPGQ